jgi:hypothetical protein
MTVDSFLNGDFMDAIEDESIEEDEQVRLIFFLTLCGLLLS